MMAAMPSDMPPTAEATIRLELAREGFFPSSFLNRGLYIGKYSPPPEGGGKNMVSGPGGGKNKKTTTRTAKKEKEKKETKQLFPTR